MKHQMNRILCALMAVLFCVGLLASPASAAEGTCGDNLAWTLENGVLTISGSGAMTDFSKDVSAPWMEVADLIQCVKVGEGVTSVGDMAFYHCTNLTAVSLASTVKSLGELAFAGCYSMTQISIPGVEEIGWGCFYDCTALPSVTLPDCLRVISDKAFYHCSSLAGITIPASVERFGTSVFCYCENLTYVRILAQITILPYWTFYGCDRLKELYLPSSIESVEQDALSECPNLNYVSYTGSADVKQEIENQLSGETQKSAYDTSGTKVGYTQTDGAVITTTTNNGTSGTGTTIDATVTDPSGWEDVVDSITGTMNSGKEPTVDVQVQGDTTMPEGALSGLSDRDVTVTIHTSDNVDWQVVMGDQTSDTLKGSQDFSLKFSKNESDKYAETVGDATSYIVTLGETTLNSTVLLPLGSEAARRVATLYIVDGKELVKVGSVIVDDDGKAAFSLAGTSEGEYLIALDVQDIPAEEVLVPEKLAQDYDITYGATLTDSQGNQYVLTGRVNKLGFGLGTLTWIIVGVLLGSVVLVGAIMIFWNKAQKKRYRAK